MKNRITVLLVEDQEIINPDIELKMLLEQEPNIQVIRTTKKNNTVIELAGEFRPAIVFLDLKFPCENSVEVAGKIKDLHPESHIVIFTADDYLPFFNQLVEVGVSGILSENAKPHQIISMLYLILEGKTIIPLKVYKQIQLNPIIYGVKRKKCLSEKEMNLMSMVAKGWTNRQIANEIFMSTRSVENYLSKIYEKLGVKSRIEAVEQIRNV